MWGRALGLITMLALAACGEAPMEGGPVGVANTPVLLHPDDPDVRQVGRLQFEGGTELSSLHPAFGGWSGLEIHPDGERVLLLSDRGTWLSGELEFDENFQLLGLKNTQIFPLLGLDGAPVSGPNSDAEGLADMGHGVYAVSFERDHRVWVYDLGRNWEFIDQAIPETLDGPPGREHWPENGGMEALSSSPLGGLWAGVEYPLIDGQSYTLWQFQVGGDDVAHSLRFEPGFGLTGLTPYDGESFLLLERNWSRQVGNHIRIRHIGLDHLDGALHGELLAQLTPEMSVDNFEGIAYGAMANGEERILLISDDNFNESQSTLLLSFSIIPADNDEG